MKKTLVVVGLLSDQAQRVQRACGSLARLKFVESRGDTPRLPNGDHCILLIRFVRHLWTTRAFTAFPRERVHFHMGGVKELINKVRALA